MTSPVCITGMGRSGTSVTAAVLHECGLHLGDSDELLPPTVHNREGHWEHARLVAISDEVLARLGGSWDDPPDAAPGWEAAAGFADLASRARESVGPLAERAPWGWKDPRSALTLPFWRRLLGELRVVVCVRHPSAVAASLKARDAVPWSRAWELWHQYNHRLLETVTAERSIVVRFEALVHDPAGQLSRLIRFLGLDPAPLQRARAHERVNAGLRHHVDDARLPQPPAHALRLYERLCAHASSNGDDAASEPDTDASLQAARQLLAEARARHYALQDEVTELTRERDGLWLQREELARRLAALAPPASGDHLPEEHERNR